MSNANFIELESCIEACVRYCDTHQEHDFVEIYHSRLEHAKAKFEDGVRVSNEKYTSWQMAVSEETRAWKKTATLLKQAQKETSLRGIANFPDKRILYWDTEYLTVAVNELSEFMSKQTQDLGELNEALKRALSSAKIKKTIATKKVSTYSRYSRMRSEGLGTLNATLGDFRKSMRHSLGEKSEEYLSIRWPMTLAPDERIF